MRRHHAYRISRVDWRFVAWCLGLLLALSWLVVGFLVWYVAVSP
jgi:hypothetical protein